MKNFVARTRIAAPAAEVFAFHEREGAFQRLTPPFEPVRLLDRQGSIRDGDRSTLQVRQGPVALSWVAEHRDYEAGRQFVDVQRDGPFAAWEHLHRVEADGPDASWMTDRIAYRLPFGALGQLFGGGFIRHKLEQMFAYRHAVLAHDQALHRRAEGRRLTVVISGASGLIGRNLAALLTSGGHRVIPLIRPGSTGSGIDWDPRGGTIDAAALEGVDAVVHLAGAGIAQRWTPAAKERILRSRVDGTRLLAETLAGLQDKPAVFVSSSAVGIYGDRPDGVLDEGAAEGDPAASFLTEVVQAWEAAAEPARAAGIRVVHPRTGVVLSPRGGALAKMLPPFLLGVGGPVGSGRQGFSWIGIDDAIGGLYWMILDGSLEGPVNLTAPGALPFGDFARSLGRVLRRPAFAPLPGFVVKLLFGQMGEETLLGGALVRPGELEAAGYPFLHREVEPALRHVLGRALSHPGRHDAPEPEPPTTEARAAARAVP